MGVLTTSIWGAGGCALNKQTELVPGVMSQIQVPRNLKTVRVDVQPQGGQGVCFIQSVDPTTGGVTLPRTLGIVPNGDNARLVTVTVTGYTAAEGDANAPQLTDCLLSPFQDAATAGAVKILRRSRQRYVGNKILFLPMPLRYSCWEAAQCKDNETCVAGACVPADVDSTMLSEFNDNLVNGTTNTCFSPKQCLADVAPAKVVDQAKCIYAYPLPMSAGTGVNVRVYYDHGESEILDIDPPTTPAGQGEGFTIPDPAKPQQFQLAPNLCAMVNGTTMSPRRILEVRMATLCAPKTLLQPVCEGELNDPHSLPDGGQTTDGGCNLSNELQPAPSALYMLMDNGTTIAPVFGTGAIPTVMGFSLGDPVFRTTSLAFKLLPHLGTDCAMAPTTSFSMPDVPFDLASKVQQKVALIVGTPISPMTDQPLFIDAALQPNGAYKALRDFRGTQAFNRMAIMLIINRSVTKDCMTAPDDAVVEAGKAFNTANVADRIYTYAVVLGTKMGGQDATVAQNIANAGGPMGATQFFDARTNAAAGAIAFNTVVSDLGSCLYEKPANIDTSTASAAVISYTDPLTQMSSSVTFDPACNEAAQNTANGWNLDANRVRICGKACGDLRSVLSNAANFALSQNLPAPNIPVTATQICK